MSQRDDYHTQLTQTQADLATTKQNLAKTQKIWRTRSNSWLTAQAARKKAEDTAAAQSKRADDLANQLAKATQDRDAAQAELAAYKGHRQDARRNSPSLLTLIKQDQDTIDAINDEKKVLSRTIARLQNQLNELVGSENYVVTLPADLKGKVVVVDPKWDFVVLNIGDEQGVLQDGEMLVSRDGKLVAKVVVRTVEKDRCIANIIPGWKLGEVFEGDIVTPAHPAS